VAQTNVLQTDAVKKLRLSRDEGKGKPPKGGGKGKAKAAAAAPAAKKAATLPPKGGGKGKAKADTAVEEEHAAATKGGGKKRREREQLRAIELVAADERRDAEAAMRRDAEAAEEAVPTNSKQTPPRNGGCRGTNTTLNRAGTQSVQFEHSLNTSFIACAFFRRGNLFWVLL
jgi:hypothetical protein